MKLSLFSFAICAFLATTFIIHQANATTAAELLRICDQREKWCIRAEANYGPAPFLSSNDAECYNYDFGRMCAYGDNSNAILTCDAARGIAMVAHFRGNKASLEGNTQDFDWVWGQNGPRKIEWTGKINLYASCK